MIDNINVALVLKDLIEAVHYIEPFGSRLEQCYFLNMQEGAYITITAGELKSIIKYLKDINFELEIVDNKLKIERYETKAIRDNKNRRKGNGSTGSACDDSTIQ